MHRENFPTSKIKQGQKSKKRIGLFGGTFDPVHNGHLIIAESVREQQELDEVIFIPSASPPHKHHILMFGAEERFRLLAESVRDNPYFSVSDIEMRRKGPSFTIDTIREIRAGLGAGTELFFILGRDNLYELETWKETTSILDECTILVANRIWASERPIPGWLESRVVTVTVPLIAISSSDVRTRIREGKSVRYLVPEPVLDAIKSLK